MRGAEQLYPEGVTKELRRAEIADGTREASGRRLDGTRQGLIRGPTFCLPTPRHQRWLRT